MNLSEKNSTYLKEAIIKTIAFFDLFDFAPTENELWSYAGKKGSLDDYVCCLEDLLRRGFLESKEGLYFLSGRVGLVYERKKRYNYSNRKIKIAMKMSRLFRMIPWVSMIALANVVGRDNLRDGSDVDFFVVSKKGRLWLSRFFLASLAKLMNKRPQKNNTRDKVCLSFFVAEDSLNLSFLKESPADKYFDFWLLGLVPIYDRGGVYEKLLKENKEILDGYPNAKKMEPSQHRSIKTFANNFYYLNWELFFGGLEKLIKKIQLRIMPDDLKKAIPQKKGVYVDDRVIKLHLKDRRSDFIKKYNEILAKTSIK